MTPKFPIDSIVRFDDDSLGVVTKIDIDSVASFYRVKRFHYNPRRSTNNWYKESELKKAYET
jgi:hypothetical protein